MRAVRGMAPLPLELVWLIAVYADHARVVRRLCRAARDLRPERSSCRCWSWMLDEISACGNVGELLLDLYVESSPACGGRRTGGRRATRRARLRRPCPQRLLYREPLAHVPRTGSAGCTKYFAYPRTSSTTCAAISGGRCWRWCDARPHFSLTPWRRAARCGGPWTSFASCPCTK